MIMFWFDAEGRDPYWHLPKLEGLEGVEGRLCVMRSSFSRHFTRPIFFLRTEASWIRSTSTCTFKTSRRMAWTTLTSLCSMRE